MAIIKCLTRLFDQWNILVSYFKEELSWNKSKYFKKFERLFYIKEPKQRQVTQIREHVNKIFQVPAKKKNCKNKIWDTKTPKMLKIPEFKNLSL